jgi:hypothetical protein
MQSLNHLRSFRGHLSRLPPPMTPRVRAPGVLSFPKDKQGHTSIQSHGESSPFTRVRYPGILFSPRLPPELSRSRFNSPLGVNCPVGFDCDSTSCRFISFEYLATYKSRSTLYRGTAALQKTPPLPLLYGLSLANSQLMHRTNVD